MPEKKELELFAPTVTSIDVSVDKSLIGNAGVQVALPKDWIFANAEDAEKSTLAFSGTAHKANKVSTSKDGNLIYLNFDKIIDYGAALAAEKSEAILIDLITEHFPVKLMGRFVPMTKEQEEKWVSTFAKTVAKKTVSLVKSAVLDQSKSNNESSSPNNKPTDLVFVLDEIRTTETCLQIDEERNLAQCKQL
jgi:hypothetical protein